MRILLIAPHPFYQERGTPIDVLLVLRVLGERPNTRVDLLTLHEGSDVSIPNVNIIRIPPPPGVHTVRPGFSLNKLVCFFYLFRQAWRLLRRQRYDVMHAGEEAAFIALILGRLHGVPYVYDLDSSVAQQMVEQKPILRFLSPMFNALESLAIRRSLMTLPVCNALAELCRRRGARHSITLHDISQLKTPGAPATGFLKAELGIQGVLMLYSGNLEAYQGIDLLLESFALAAPRQADLYLAVIGGTPHQVRRYQRKADQLGLAGRAFLLGPRPFAALDRHLAEADILVCPRIRGLNTPMKVFAFLHAGRAVLVTDLPTHSQILTPEVVLMAPATPAGFSAGMLQLARDPALRAKLSEAGRAFVEADHTYPAHQRRLNDAYDWIEAQLKPRPA